MTFAPTKKTSKSRSRRRTTNWLKLTAKKLLNRTSLQYDAEGNAIGLSHFADENGMYNGRQVVTKKSPKKPVKTIRA